MTSRKTGRELWVRPQILSPKIVYWYGVEAQPVIFIFTDMERKLCCTTHINTGAKVCDLMGFGLDLSDCQPFVRIRTEHILYTYALDDFHLGLCDVWLFAA